MFKNKFLKVLAVLMVLNILIVPLTSFSPQAQNKYTVHASEGLIDIRFFNAMVAMIGISSAGIAAMSPSFRIPEVDMVALKDQFQTTLDADATKKAAWMTAQADYLAGGVAKTMGAVELSKIGLSDVYTQFLNYIKNKLPNVDIKNISSNTEEKIVDGYKFELNRLPNTKYQFLYPVTIPWEQYSIYQTGYNQLRSTYRSSYENITTNGSVYFINSYMYSSTGTLLASITLSRNGLCMYADINKYYDGSNLEINKYFIQYLNQFGINANQAFNLSSIGIIGSTSYIDNNIINFDTDSISVLPTIPWIDPAVPVGTIVTPAISAPYAGAVPIDVPITAPIDPPIDDPVDPPADTTLLGTVAAILAGITPISGLLDNILDSELDIADVISVGLTNVIDGIGDITGTLTGGITAGITSVVTGITDLTNSLDNTVADQTLNFDPIKNIPSVIFTKFPFCIPWDFAKIIAFMNDSAREPPDINLVIPFSNSLSSLGIGDFTFDLDFTMFDNFAGFIRMAELIVFSLLVMFKTKTLIWG